MPNTARFPVVSGMISSVFVLLQLFEIQRHHCPIHFFKQIFSKQTIFLTVALSVVHEGGHETFIKRNQNETHYHIYRSLLMGSLCTYFGTKCPRT